MRLNRLFTVETHEEYGMLGLRPKDCPTFDPLTGMATAHDMLEHPPGDTGEVHEELMAFGASIVTRYLGGYWAGKRGPVEENWDSDVANILQYVDTKGRPLIAPPGAQGTRRLDDDHLEETVANAGRLMSVANEDWSRDAGLGDAAVISRWLRIGYRKALQRYKGTDPGTLCHLFQMVERQADDFLRDAIEGQEVRIIIDTDRCLVRVEEEYPEE